MPINILMPALSPTMEKGNLAKWLKKEGETIKAGDVIAEIETDKATMEVEAADEGVLAKIIVPEGTTDVPVNQPIAVLASEGEDVTTAAAQAGRSTRPSAPGATRTPASEVASPAPGDSQDGHDALQSAPPARQPEPAPVSPGPVRTNGHDGQRVFSSPLARRLAKESGIDIARVQGTGPHGRVIARDIEAARKSAGVLAPAARAPLGAPPSIGVRPPTDDKIRALFEEGTYEVVPHDNMRKIIAQRMAESTATIPHFYLTLDCNLDRLLAMREEINASAPNNADGKPVYKLSVNDFTVKALALALQRIPDANVTWTEGALLKHRHSDVGVAVALAGGLITPVVRKAETKTLSVISQEMKDFAARARIKRLKPEEYQGGTTAVSNLGMYGIKQFTAVINPPQATILAVGAGEARALVQNGAVSVATQMTVTLSCDHRAVDGALGAELIAAFKNLIEHPMMMLV
jgi:pyruvate dehydrogenase E2 component (dihydrolipoamide acetyltransferase)